MQGKQSSQAICLSDFSSVALFMLYMIL